MLFSGLKNSAPEQAEEKFVFYGDIEVTKTEGKRSRPSGTSRDTEEMDSVIYKTTDGTEFIFPKTIDTSKQDMTIKTAVEAWGGVPEEIRKKGQKRIYFVDYLNPQDDYWRKTYKNFSRSYATGGEYITFWAYTDHDFYYVRTSMVHEMGHGIDRYSTGEGGKISLSEIWKKAMASDKKVSKMKSPTKYGENSNAEDFAVSLENFVMSPNWFEENFPNRTKIIKDILKGE